MMLAMKTMDEFEKLISIFPNSASLFDRVEAVAAERTPEPYRGLLNHDDHMTVRMEEFHGSPVRVKVLYRHLDGEIYTRQTLLQKTNDGRIIQFALVRLNLGALSPAVREEILSEKTPLGTILINHNVGRRVQLKTILKISLGPELAQLFDCQRGRATYGRSVIIFCDQRPAIDVLEVAVPAGS